MSLLISIGICAVFVALVFTLDCFGDALREAQWLGVDNPFTRSPKLSYFVHFVLGILLFPVWLLCMMVPSAWLSVIAGIRAVVLEPAEI